MYSIQTDSTCIIGKGKKMENKLQSFIGKNMYLIDN